MFRLSSLPIPVPVRIAVLISATVLAAPPGARAFEPEPLPPSLKFEEETVVVSGLPSGGSVAVFGVGLDLDQFMPTRLEVWDVLVADASGEARLELGQPVPKASSWAAVELGDGGLTIDSPLGSAEYEVPFPAGAISTSLDSLIDSRPALAVLWVRPTSTAGPDAGAWGGEFRDGSQLDGDGEENRLVTALLVGVEAIGASPTAPAAMTARDVLVAIDPDTLETYGAQLVE